MANLNDARNSLLPPPSGPEDAIFRPIHYLGSKMRMIDAIQSATVAASPSAKTFCDAFSGSGTLTGAMSRIYSVTSIDIQEYSRVLAVAVTAKTRPNIKNVVKFIEDIRQGEDYCRLCSIFAPAIDFENAALLAASTGLTDDIVSVLENGSVKFGEQGKLHYLDQVRIRILQNKLEDSAAASISYVYGGVYFSYAQSVVIDAIRNSIEIVENVGLRDFYLAALISTVSECANTIGKQFAQPIRIISKDGKVKKGLLGKVIGDRGKNIFGEYRRWIERYISLPLSAAPSVAVQGDVTETLNQLANSGREFDVIYADPPYTRDHYSRYYHLLETLALRDVPEITLTNLHGKTEPSRGLYRAGRHQSLFCIKTQAGHAFSALFSAARKFGCPLIISYSPFSKANDDHPRLMEIQRIIELGLQHYSSHVIARFDDFSHSKLNSQGNNKERQAAAEVLITFRP